MIDHATKLRTIGDFTGFRKTHGADYPMMPGMTYENGKEMWCFPSTEELCNLGGSFRKTHNSRS
jgi:hypothetical protein